MLHPYPCIYIYGTSTGRRLGRPPHKAARGPESGWVGLGARLSAELGGARGLAKARGWGSGLDFGGGRRSAAREASQKEVQGGTPRM